jgi:hypothetical protein
MAKPHDNNADENICKALDVFVARMAQDYDQATLRSLKDALASELTNPKGTSLPALTAAVRRIPGFQDSEHAELVARTLSYGASNLANRWAWQASGVVKMLKWYTAEDGDVCEFCEALHGRVIGVENNFLRRGDAVAGTQDDQGARRRVPAASRWVPVLYQTGGHRCLLKMG